MNAIKLAAIRKLKMSHGAFLWQPALAEGRQDTLLGYVGANPPPYDT